jgi:hypothetical protein
MRPSLGVIVFATAAKWGSVAEGATIFLVVGICLEFHFEVLFHFFNILFHLGLLEYVNGLRANLACGDIFLELI